VQPYLAQSITPNARLHVVGHYLTTGNRVSRWLRSRCQRAPAQSDQTAQLSTDFRCIPRDRGHFGHRTSLSYRHYECPWVPFPYALAQTQTATSLAPSMLNSPTGTTHPVGTGPFIFHEWIPTTTSPLTPIPATASRTPYLDSITFKQSSVRNLAPMPSSPARSISCTPARRM